MPDVESNAGEHGDWLMGLVESFDFERPGVESSLGEDLAGDVYEGIRERTVGEQLGPDGSPLKALDPKYKARKGRKGLPEEIGVLSGQMLSRESILGKVDITPDEVTIRYGTGRAVTRYSTGHEAREDEPTDVEKAAFFEAGGREFFALDDAIADRLVERCRGVVRECVDEANRGEA